MQLFEKIIQKISREGPISFSDYMEMVLYEPGLGYYTSAKEKIGSQGDYYTSSILSPIFGRLIGRQLEEMWQLMGREDFTIVEYGAGTGALCSSILDYLKNNKPLYNQLHYCIIEKSPAMREKEKRCLNEKVNWYDTINDIGKFSGCVLSNELVDNFSVHQVIMQDDLTEVFVGYESGGFIEILKPADKSLKQYLQQLNVTLPNGFRTEINLQALGWLKEIGENLKKGFVLTIDYGYPSVELYREYRCHGTVVCYHQHQVNNTPYNHIGEQDITAHVNFSALKHWGSKSGLECCGFTQQGHFLRSLGLMDHLRALEENEKDNKEKVLCLYNLLADIGSKLKVLIQQKGLPKSQLSGLKLASSIV